jgi:4-azaleucine resistance transporter AzlC
MLFTSRGLLQGIKGAHAPAGSAVIYGLAFGLLADQTGLSLAAAVAMSALIYSGSAQFVALQAWGDPIPVAAIAGAIVAVNARYFLLGAALRPWFHDMSPAKAYGSLFLLSDGNWAPAIREFRAGRLDAAYMLGVGAALYTSWIASTAIGHALGNAIPDPKRFGLDFVLLAFFVVLAVALWRGKSDLLPFATAAVVALVVERLVPGQWYMVAGALAGSLAAALRPMRSGPREAADDR